MEKYVFDEKAKALLESSCVPFAIYQFLDDRVVTHVVTDGFCDIMGVDRATVYDSMENHLYDSDHPDDVARLGNAVIEFATFWRRIVLPAFGGETIIPLCPLPIGLIRSMILMATLHPGCSRGILTLGKIGVIFSKSHLPIATSGLYPFTVSRRRRAANLSFSFLALQIPFKISPVLRLNLIFPVHRFPCVSWI